MHAYLSEILNPYPCVHQCTCLKYEHRHTEAGVGVYVLIPLTIPYEYTEHNCVTVLVSQQCLRCMLVCVGEPGYYGV